MCHSTRKALFIQTLIEFVSTIKYFKFDVKSFDLIETL